MKRLFTFLFLVCAFSTAAPLPKEILTRRPKLVVVLVIDQFRADYLTRFQAKLIPEKKPNGDVGGFSYLMAKGAYFPSAEYGMLQNMTGPGHATILTGSYPYQSGIPINKWFDKAKNAAVYCVEDASSPLVGPPNPEKETGMSPKNLVGTTVGDELKNAGYTSRVVSVSLKDRAAILMGGHRADAVFWFDKSRFQWVSSRFYLPNGKLPAWTQKLNAEIKIPASHKEKEEALNGPTGSSLTISIALQAITEFKLGSGKNTDLLAVSFSSHDFAGHAFGPNSAEMEAMTLDEDKQISGFLNYLRKKIPGGLENVTVVLTADHGIAPLPDYAKQNKLFAGRIDEKTLSSTLNGLLENKFGPPSAGRWVVAVGELNIFLNRALIAEKSVEPKVVEDTVRRYLLANEEGVAFVFTQTDYQTRILPPGLLEQQILRTYIPGKSGDVVIIQKPFFIGGDDPAAHMSGYSYDRTVPLVIAGPHIRSGIYAAGRVIDLAPTLSFLLGTIPPALSEGRVLDEIFLTKGK